MRAWTGYRVRDLLADAGIHADADMVLSTSIDGFTAGTPVEALTDGRDSLLAIGMNGEPLPTEHGYPARLVVPGLYGYVSATKWVVDLELTRFDSAEAYWTRLGWSPRGPDQDRIAHRRAAQRPGRRPRAGDVRRGRVGAEPRREAVEVRIDDGPWQPAQLGASYSNDTWRLWSFPWQAEASGSHTISVRATDNTGATQTEQWADPVPDGARAGTRSTSPSSSPARVRVCTRHAGKSCAIAHARAYSASLLAARKKRWLFSPACWEMSDPRQVGSHADASGSKGRGGRTPYYRFPGPSGGSPRPPDAIVSVSALGCPP